MKKLRAFFKGGLKADAPKTDVFDLDAPVDLLNASVVEDPYPLYAALRARKPVAPLVSGGYLLTRHEDIRSAFTMRELGNTPSRFSVLAPRNRGKHVAADLAANIPPFLDMPAHKVPRQALSRAFFATFETHKNRVFETAKAMVDRLEQGEHESIATLASPFALKVMSDFVGLEAEPTELKRISQAFFHLFAPLGDRSAFNELNEQLAAARAVIRDAMMVRRSTSEDCLLSHLLAFQSEHPDLSDAQIVDLALLVFADGIENIEAGIATSLHCVLSVASQPALDDIEKAVAEALRLNTPGQIIPRVAQEPVHLHGVQIDAGMPVFLALGSGNRDETVFDDPDAFNLERPEEALTFGLGRHRCIGAPLGLLQITAMVQALMARGVTLSQKEAKLEYVPRFGHRWPKGLCVNVN